MTAAILRPRVVDVRPRSRPRTRARGARGRAAARQRPTRMTARSGASTATWRSRPGSARRSGAGRAARGRAAPLPLDGGRLRHVRGRRELRPRVGSRRVDDRPRLRPLFFARWLRGIRTTGCRRARASPTSSWTPSRRARRGVQNRRATAARGVPRLERGSASRSALPSATGLFTASAAGALLRPRSAGSGGPRGPGARARPHARLAAGLPRARRRRGRPSAVTPRSRRLRAALDDVLAPGALAARGRAGARAFGARRRPPSPSARPRRPCSAVRPRQGSCRAARDGCSSWCRGRAGGEAARGARVLRASHPLPDARSVGAARAATRLFASAPSGPRLALVSGGSSSVLAWPLPGTSLAQKRAIVRAALASGAPIELVNLVRRHLSRVKGGGLLRAAAGQPVITLVARDVVGGRRATSARNRRCRTSPRSPRAPPPAPWACRRARPRRDARADGPAVRAARVRRWLARRGARSSRR